MFRVSVYRLPFTVKAIELFQDIVEVLFIRVLATMGKYEGSM